MSADGKQGMKILLLPEALHVCPVSGVIILLFPDRSYRIWLLSDIDPFGVVSTYSFVSGSRSSPHWRLIDSISAACSG